MTKQLARAYADSILETAGDIFWFTICLGGGVGAIWIVAHFIIKYW